MYVVRYSQKNEEVNYDILLALPSLSLTRLLFNETYYFP
jgi:hypothetical protein